MSTREARRNTSRAELALIRQASPSAETTYGLAQAFMHMIRQHAGQQLDTWLDEVEVSHLPELESFAKGIRAATKRQCLQG